MTTIVLCAVIGAIFGYHFELRRDLRVSTGVAAGVAGVVFGLLVAIMLGSLIPRPFEQTESFLLGELRDAKGFYLGTGEVESTSYYFLYKKGVVDKKPLKFYHSKVTVQETSEPAYVRVFEEKPSWPFLHGFALFFRPDNKYEIFIQHDTIKFDYIIL